MTNGTADTRRHAYPPLLLMALGAIMLAACGPGTSTATTSTATAAPTLVSTATATPTPCTSWQIVASPNPAGFQPSALYSVAAAAPTNVWAVGRGNNPKPPVGYLAPVNHTVIDRWDGSTWSLVSRPPADELQGVAVISSSDIWAVGGGLTYGVGYHPYQPLIQHWNGAQWSVVPGGTMSRLAIELDRVAAVATNDVWAVGTVDPSGGKYRPLVEHWNSTVWQASTAAIPTGTAVGGFSAVTTIPGSQGLWAVGNSQRYDVPTGEVQALIEQWDGTSWQIMPGPAVPSGVDTSLSGVVALSPTDAWAVGQITGTDRQARPLILHWDGVAWQNATRPDTTGFLSSVAAASAHDVRAVGSNAGTKQALIEQWKGSTWQTVTAPSPAGATESDLRGVTSDSAGNFWAVGSSQSSASTSQTLIERCR